MTALLLDLDNTLVDRDAAFRAWLATLVPAADVDRLFHLDRGGYGPKAALHAAIAAAAGITRADARRRFTRDFPTFVRLRPDADALLAAFPGPTAIVTNGPSELQRGKIAAAGLEGRVTAVVVSGELGVEKPDAAIFHAAIERLPATSHATARMVGDHPVNDVAGARSAGLEAVFVRSRWFRAPDGVPAVDQLTELLPERP